MSEVKEKKQRSLAQNRAMHKLFTDIANEMLSQGIGMKVLLENFELEITPEDIKKLWRAIQFQKTGKKSTKELNTDELDVVWVAMIPILRKAGLEAEFPSIQTMLEKEYRQYHNR